MNDTTDSILESLDGEDRELFPFLPYLLQDLFEMGAFPDVIAALLQRHGVIPANVLDLGCGKGAVSIYLAGTFGCQVHGIDAMPEFIADAARWAAMYHVEHLCRFEVSDIRQSAKELRGYDLIILGAIGPIFGDTQMTLATLRSCLTPGGCVILDDAYLPDDCEAEKRDISTRSESIEQIRRSGFDIVAEEILPVEKMVATDREMFMKIERRAQELSAQYPDRSVLFERYIVEQKAENNRLEEEFIGATRLLRKQ